MNAIHKYIIKGTAIAYLTIFVAIALFILILKLKFDEKIWGFIVTAASFLTLFIPFVYMINLNRSNLAWMQLLPVSRRNFLKIQIKNLALSYLVGIILWLIIFFLASMLLLLFSSKGFINLTNGFSFNLGEVVTFVVTMVLGWLLYLPEFLILLTLSVAFLIVAALLPEKQKQVTPYFKSIQIGIVIGIAFSLSMILLPALARLFLLLAITIFALTNLYIGMMNKKPHPIKIDLKKSFFYSATIVLIYYALITSIVLNQKGFDFNNIGLAQKAFLGQRYFNEEKYREIVYENSNLFVTSAYSINEDFSQHIKLPELNSDARFDKILESAKNIKENEERYGRYDFSKLTEQIDFKKLDNEELEKVLSYLNGKYLDLKIVAELPLEKIEALLISDNKRLKHTLLDAYFFNLEKNDFRQSLIKNKKYFYSQAEYYSYLLSLIYQKKVLPYELDSVGKDRGLASSKKTVECSSFDNAKYLEKNRVSFDEVYYNLCLAQDLRNNYQISSDFWIKGAP